MEESLAEKQEVEESSESKAANADSADEAGNLEKDASGPSPSIPEAPIETTPLDATENVAALTQEELNSKAEADRMNVGSSESDAAKAVWAEDAGNLEEDSSDPLLNIPEASSETTPLVEKVVELTPEELEAKAEADRLFELHEQTKEIIRRQLRKVKVDYRAIAQKNREIPVMFRVPRSKFDLDPRIKEPRQARFQKEVEEVYRHYEWEGKRSVIACEKIQKYFLDNIETHHKSVKDLEHTVEAHTFRHRFLTPEFWDVFNMDQETLAIEKTVVTEVVGSEQKKQAPPEPVRRFFARDMIGAYAGKKYDVKTKHAIRQLEERLQRRYVRECELAELNTLKVPDDFEAEEDVEAIKFATEHSGDYKLKSGEEYLLGDKTTTAQRRKKILDLKIMIYETVKEYNDRFKILEDEKVAVIECCRKLEHEIHERHKYLPTDQRVALPVIHDIDPSENPESTFRIDDYEVSQLQNQKLEAAGLLKRKKIANGEEVEETTLSGTPVEEKVKVKRRIHKPGDFIRNRNDPRAPKVVLKKLEQPFPTLQLTGPTIKTIPKRKEVEGLSMPMFRYRKAFFNPKTEAAQRRRDRVLTRRIFERDFFLDRLRKLIDYFKQRVLQLRNERIERQLDVKLMTIALLAYIQELDIAKDFEANARDVFERYETHKVELGVAKQRHDASKRRLNQGKRDQRTVEDFLTKLAKEVSALINEQGRYSEYLWKVFRKRFGKRVENADDEEEEADENASETSTHSTESSDSSSTDEHEIETGKVSGAVSSSSSDSYDDLFKPHITKLDLNVCPDDLEQEVYDKICDFRQNKAILEADLAAQKEVVRGLTREFNVANSAHKKLHARMGGLQHEISSLQRERQTLINNLRKLVVLKASQIQCIDEDKLETDNGPILERIKRNFPNIDDVIVFPKDGTLKLDQRFEELKDELLRGKRKQKQARYMIIRLREVLRKKEDHVAMLLEECRKEMIGRFGRVVDMEDVCAGSINLEILSLMQDLEVKRKKHYAEHDQLNKKIEKARHDLATVTKANSEYYILLAMLEKRQREVDFCIYQQEQSDGEDQKVTKLHRGSGDSEVSGRTADNADVIDEMYCLEDQLINQEAKIVYLRETIANCKLKGKVPEIVLMTSIPDTVASRFMTFKELQEYKSYLNHEVETLYSKNNTEQLLQSTSVMPSFEESRSDNQKNAAAQRQSLRGQEQEILEQLDEITKRRETDEEITENESDLETLNEEAEEIEDRNEGVEEIEEEMEAIEDVETEGAKEDEQLTVELIEDE